MSNFLGGGAVECGPSNALKDVGALVERDYGAQRVSRSMRLRSERDLAQVQSNLPFGMPCSRDPKERPAPSDC